MKSLFSNKVHTKVCTKKNHILLSTVYLGVFAGHKFLSKIGKMCNILFRWRQSFFWHLKVAYSNKHRVIFFRFGYLPSESDHEKSENTIFKSIERNQ